MRIGTLEPDTQIPIEPIGFQLRDLYRAVDYFPEYQRRGGKHRFNGYLIAICIIVTARTDGDYKGKNFMDLFHDFYKLAGSDKFRLWNRKYDGKIEKERKPKKGEDLFKGGIK